jgi:valyl-tRNA synthetase
MLRLLHPVMPFITEQVWSTLHEVAPDATHGEPLLVVAAWPVEVDRDAAIETETADLMELVRGLRNLRTEAGLAAGAWLPLTIAPSDEAARQALTRGTAYVESLARVRPIVLASDGDAGGSEPGSPMTASRLGTAWLGETGEGPNVGAARREAAIRDARAGIERLRALLATASFVERAPAEVVERERARLSDLEAQLQRLEGG